MRKAIPFILMLFILVGVVCAADYIPNRMTYSGYLRDSANNPLTGTYTMGFAIYDAASGGNNVWDETGVSVAVDRGIWSYSLGATNPLNFTPSQNYYLERKIATQTLSPRINITQSMWAQQAANASFSTSASNSTFSSDSGSANRLVVGNNYQMANLTVTDKITFAFGQMIDNIVNGWLKITGNLNVTGTVNATEIGTRGNARIGNHLSIPSGSLQVGNPNTIFNSSGDASFSGKVSINSSLNVKSFKNGAGLIVTESGTTTKFTSFGATTSYDGSDSTICDTTAPFTAANVGDWLGLSAPAEYAGIMGEIVSYYNTSCVQVADYDGSPAITFSGLSYYVFSHPDFVVMNGGAVGMTIGHDPDDRLHIYAPNMTGPRTMKLEVTAGVSDHEASVVQLDVNNHSGGIGQKIVVSSGIPLLFEKVQGLKIEMDRTNVANSSVDFLVLSGISSVLLYGNNDVTGIKMQGRMDNLILKGSSDTLASAYADATNITRNMTDSVSNIPIFTADNSIVYIGGTVNFTRIAVSLQSIGSKTITPLYSYCDNTGTWKTLTGITDTTGGFRNLGGTIAFINPVDRGSCNKQISGTAFSDTKNYTYIAIQRTQNIMTAPVEKEFTIGGSENTFLLTEEYMKVHPVDTPPVTCNAVSLGAIYFDISEDDMCVCKSVGWKVIADGSACT